MKGKAAFNVQPDVTAAGVLRAWFTDPPGVVIQFTQVTRGTKDLAEWLVSSGYARLRDRFPQAQKLILVMDLSLMDGRDPAARSVMIDKARESNSLFGQMFIIPPIKTNAVYLTTLHAAAALLTAFGIDLKIESSVEEVIERRQLKPAPRIAT